MTSIYKRTLIFLALFSLLFNNVIAQNQQLANEILIQNLSATKLYLNYSNEFNDFNSLTLAPKETIKVNSSIPVVFYSSTIQRKSSLAFPGDLLKFSVEKNLKYILSTASVTRTKELNLLDDIQNRILLYSPQNKGLVHIKYTALYQLPLKRDSALFQDYKNALSDISTYEQSATLDVHTKDFIRRNLFYDYLKEKSMYLSSKLFVQNKLPVAFKDSLINLKQYLNCDECIPIDTYRNFAINYLSYLEGIKDKEVIYSYINDQFSGSTKDFLLFSLLKNYSSNKPELLNEYYSRFLDDCKNTAYKNYIGKLVSTNNLVQESTAKELLSASGLNLSFKELLKKHSGKVIYIDFWASWCAPCLDEMPASIKLAANMQKKDIVFIYLSLDKNNNNWESSIKTIKLEHAEHYLLLKNFNSDLAKRYKITTIPHYILIGRDGKVLDANAARPSETKLHNKLKTLFPEIN